MWRILTWLLLIVAWSLMIYFHNQLYKAFWNIAWAEKYLWESRVIYVLAWCLFIIVGVLFLFGMWASNPTDTQSMQFGT